MKENLAPSEHQPRLMRALLQLLRAQRVAALATIEPDGSPFVSIDRKSVV